MRIGKFLALLYAGQDNSERVFNLTKDRTEAPWEAQSRVPKLPERASEGAERVRAVLKPRAKEPSVQESQLLDYLSGVDPRTSRTVGEPDAEPESAEQREQRFFESLMQAEAGLADSADQLMSPFETRRVLVADELELTFVQYCVYCWCFTAGAVGIDGMINQWVQFEVTSDRSSTPTEMSPCDPLRCSEDTMQVVNEASPFWTDSSRIKR